MVDSIIEQNTTVSRYRSMRLNSRIIIDEGDTAIKRSSHTIDLSDPANPATSGRTHTAAGTESIDTSVSPEISTHGGEHVSAPHHRRSSRDTDDARVDAPADLLQDVSSNIGPQEDTVASINAHAHNNTDRSTLSLRQGYSLCAVHRHSLSSIERKIARSHSTATRSQDGPPRSSNITATEVTKAGRVPTVKGERHVGCLSFLKRGVRHRAKSGRVKETVTCGIVTHLSMQHFCSACAQNTRVSTTTTPHAASKERRLLGHAGPPSITSSGVARSLSVGPPYDMSRGAVQPQYFCANSPSAVRQALMRQRSVGWSNAADSSSPNVRTGSTLAKTSSTSREPLIDLTPHYRPPPQHRDKGRGFRPEQVGCSKLIDYATSPRDSPSSRSSARWRDYDYITMSDRKSSRTSSEFSDR